MQDNISIMKNAFFGKNEVLKKVKVEVVRKMLRLAMIDSSCTLAKKQKAGINAMKMRRHRNTKANIKLLQNKIAKYKLRWFMYICRILEDRLPNKVQIKS